MKTFDQILEEIKFQEGAFVGGKNVSALGGPKETRPQWIGGINSKNSKAIQKALKAAGHKFDDFSSAALNKKNNTHFISMQDKKGFAALQKIKKKLGLPDNSYGTPGYNKSGHKGKADSSDLPKHIKHDADASYM